MTNYISTENTQYDEQTTKQIVAYLRDTLGWDVEYGVGLHWQFADEAERDDFEHAFGEAVNAVTGE